MVHFKVSALLPIPANVYFIERDSAAFRSLVAKMCKLGSLDLAEGWQEGEKEVYKFVTKPDIDNFVPKPLQRHLTGELKYTDIITYDPELLAQKEGQKQKYVMPVKSLPPLLGSKTKIESMLTIEEVTEDTSRQTLEGDVEIHIFGLGKIAENVIVDNLHKVYQGVPKIVERWVLFRNEVLQSTGGKDVLVSGRPTNSGVPWINEQIRALLKADEQEMERHRSTAMSDLLRRSLDGSMLRRAPLQDGDDMFYDAVDEASWAELTAALGDDEEAREGMLRDRREASKWYLQSKKSGHMPPTVEVDAASAPAARASYQGGASELDPVQRRFSKNYKDEFTSWADFWDEAQVPVQDSGNDLKARLGHLLSLGFVWGIFKPGRSKSGHSHGTSASSNGHVDASAHTSEASRRSTKEEVEHQSIGAGGAWSPHR